MFTPHPRQRSAEDRLIAAGSLLLGGGKAGGLSRRNRYCDIPSMTVGILLEMLRPVPVLIRNPDCEGGDMVTIWPRHAIGGLPKKPAVIARPTRLLFTGCEAAPADITCTSTTPPYY